MSTSHMVTPLGPGGPAGSAGANTVINTMTDPLAQATKPSGLAGLTRLFATIGLIGSIAALFWRLGAGIPTAADFLAGCSAGDAACLVDPVVRAAVLDPTLLAAGMFATAIGAFADAKTRPATGLVLGLASVALGVALVVTR